MNSYGRGDSLKTRYIYKLGANIINLIVNLIIQSIIPRGLGPKLYGDFNFITNFFSQIIGFLDLGTSTAFYTKLSQRPKESGLVTFYLYFSLYASVTTIIFIVCTHLFFNYSRLWPGQEIFFVYLGAVWGILTWFSQVLNKMTDAYGLTVPSEQARAGQRILALIVIVIMYLMKKLSLANFFYYNFALLLFICVLFLLILRKNGFSVSRQWGLTIEQTKSYVKEFYAYSSPLISFSIIGLIVGILDRWLLQVFSGSEQQGFFSLSYQIGAVCILFTSALTPLLTREFSIAYAKNDIPLMALNFRRYIPLMYSMTAYLSCFILVKADSVVYIFGGEQYRNAIIVVMIMALYPIYQTYGQLSGSVFFASSQTKTYRNIGTVFMVIGLPLSYVMIAPASKMGLDAGAVGLAIKTIIIAVISVNVQLYYNTKFLGLSFWKYLAHQTGCVCFMLTVAWGATTTINLIPWLSGHILSNFLATGFLYTLVVISIVYRFPILIGLTNNDLNALFKSVLKS